MAKEEEEKSAFQAVVEAIESVEFEEHRHLSIQIDDSIREAIRAAQNSGKPASVTINIKIKPEPERRMSFAASVAAKLPRPPVSAVTLYADEQGNVHRSDPAQMRIAFPPPTPITSKTKES